MNSPKYQYQIDKYLDNNENGFLRMDFWDTLTKFRFLGHS